MCVYTDEPKHYGRKYPVHPLRTVKMFWLISVCLLCVCAIVCVFNLCIFTQYERGLTLWASSACACIPTHTNTHTHTQSSPPRHTTGRSSARGPM